MPDAIADHLLECIFNILALGAKFPALYGGTGETLAVSDHLDGFGDFIRRIESPTAWAS